MRFSAFFAFTAAVAVTAAPTNPKVRRATEEFNIIVDKAADVHAVLSAINLTVDSSDVVQVFNNTAFRGFTGTITADEADALNALDEVRAVERPVAVISAATRSNAPWGLQRISQSETVSGGTASQPMFTYTYEDTSLGAGVDIYVIDTGINIGHNEFGGRAEYGWSAYSSADDGNGHGTHCSGTAAGSSFGVSSNANLIAVRILDSSGSGTTSAVLGGLDYVVDAHNARKSQSGFIGSVASMSWGFTGRSTVVEEALTAMVDAGVHGAAAAGNSNTDACTMTPGSLGGDGPLVSVGASDIDDEIAYFSNTGPCVDVYAPGVDVLSAWRGSSSATNVISGTSMATPHIAGLMAYLLEQNGSMSPAQLKQMIVNMAIEGELQTRSDIVRGGELIIANNGVTTVQEVSIQSEAFPYEMEMVEGGNKLYW